MEASEADIVLPTHKIDIRARRREDHSEGNPYIRRLRWIARLSLALSLSPVVRIGWQLYQRSLYIIPVIYVFVRCDYVRHVVAIQGVAFLLWIRQREL